MVKLHVLKRGLPKGKFGIIGQVLGLLGVILYGTQFAWHWFGITETDKALYSLGTVAIICLSIGFMYAANFKSRIKGAPIYAALKVSLVLFLGLTLLVLVLNGIGVTMDVTYSEYANENLGFWNGFRQLTEVTSKDINSLQNFAVGIQWISRALFLTVPTIIATWGGFSVLTADSIDEAEGGILAIVAAFIVFFVVWIFKAIDVTLMFITLMVNPIMFITLMVNPIMFITLMVNPILVI